MNVTQIDQHPHNDTVLALREILERAERGQVRGLVFAIKLPGRRHRIGFTGSYFDDPIDALGTVTRIEYKLNQLISARDSEPESRSMPL